MAYIGPLYSNDRVLLFSCFLLSQYFFILSDCNILSYYIRTTLFNAFFYNICGKQGSLLIQLYFKIQSLKRKVLLGAILLAGFEVLWLLTFQDSLADQVVIQCHAVCLINSNVKKYYCVL